ncbi:MAG: alpha/beta hydrolase [Clostridia bacterium]|nr:alpha/beta hydrolase [Clostridia bacterium]
MKGLNKELILPGAVLHMTDFLAFENSQRFFSGISNLMFACLPLKKLNCEKIRLKRENGTEMRVCVMKNSTGEGKTVGILWLHGGGYVFGGPEIAAMTLPKHILEKYNCVIVSPDYTLSPSAPFPAALNDAWQTLLWMKENRERLGIEEEKFIVGGESAGGGLCAGLCLYARDNGENCIGFQMPLYPMLDDRETDTSKNNRMPVWNTRANRSAWKIYLGGADGVSKYAAPARETDFSRLPPAITIIGTLEPFYEETLRFLGRLYKAGVDTEYKIFDGCFHAFDITVPFSSVSRVSTAFLLDSMKKYIEKYISKEN